MFITRWGTCALANIGFGSHFSPIDSHKIEYSWGKDKGNHYRVAGFICDKKSYYTSNSNWPITKLSLCHVSMKLIAISRLTSSIREPAFLLTMFHPMFPGNMGWNIIRVDHARQHAWQQHGRQNINSIDEWWIMKI
jgi:hypothetical protein